MDPTLPMDDHLQRAMRGFHEHFGRAGRFAAVAPGRVNLIGEHTDYNDGFVLPMAIERQTVIVADAVQHPRVRLASAAMRHQASFELADPLAPVKADDKQPSWSNYVRGVIAGFLAKGVTVGGFDALIDSTVPVGGGLSSSASLEVAAATLLEQMTGCMLDPVEKALLCQQAEHAYAGVPCGIMDQFIAVMGEADCAMLLDCRSRRTRMVRLADPAVTVLIVNSNVRHKLAGGEYAERRQQCERAAAELGAPALRDVDRVQLLKAKDRLDALPFKRADHVVSEIERTKRGADLLTGGDWPGFGRLMYDSHASLRDAFEVSCSELDLLVELAKGIGERGGVFGSRMTGGGFGGCTVSLVRTDCAAAVGERIDKDYKAKTGIEPSVFASRPAAGARVLSL